MLSSHRQFSRSLNTSDTSLSEEIDNSRAQQEVSAYAGILLTKQSIQIEDFHTEAHPGLPCS